MYLPLNALKRCIGVLGLRPADARASCRFPSRCICVEALINQAAVAMERVQLAEAAQEADVQVESERLRNVLLSAISHDFRTPLATIIGSASTLRDSEAALGEARRRALLDTLLHEAERMNRLVGQPAGPDALQRRPHRASPRVGRDRRVDRRGARAPVATCSLRHPVALQLPQDLPLVSGDEVMLEQVLSNLLENAARHTPAGTAIDIGAAVVRNSLEVVVRDHGPGFPSGEESRVFEKFHQVRPEGAQSGFGLGLAICKAMIEAHGGSISARNAPGGGAEFRFTLPLPATEPTVP